MRYVGATTREAVRLAAGRKPVLPVSWLQYDNNWDHSINKTAPRQLLSPEHAAIELQTPLENGADGVLIWGHLDPAAPPTSPESVSAYNKYRELQYKCQLFFFCRIVQLTPENL